jgi:hypothetical protein
MGAKPKSHEQPNFVGQGKSGHALEALRKGVQSCATCHEQKFCANCHGMPMPHPQGFVRTHIQEARRNLALCQRCHDWGEQSCRQCHAKRPPSHTADFRETHPQRLADGGASCQVCHGRNACADCHRLPMPHPDNFLHAHGELAKGQQGNERQRVQNLHRQLCAHCHTIAYCRKCHLLGNP